jgi:hypothetical protein
MVRDDRKLVVVTGGLTKPVVRIFTAAGAPLAAFVWDAGRVVAMGWTSEEDLLMVEDNGEVRCPCMQQPHAPANVYLPQLPGFGLSQCSAGLLCLAGWWRRGGW